jgi:hypothetical protein
MGHTLHLTEAVTFEREDCITCGVVFFVPAQFKAQRRNDAKSFYCPSGHSMVYREGEADKLRKQLQAAEARAEQERKDKEWYKQRQADERAARETTERRLSAAKGQQTKLRNRIKNGVCPCCTRTFSNLQRHMATQHPEFTPEPLEENNG